MVAYATALYLFFIPTPFAPPDERLPFYILGLVVTGTFLLPIIFSLITMRIGKIKSLEMETQGERNWPLLQTSVIYFVILYFVHRAGIPPFIQVFMLGATACIILALIINLKWKISLHMIGIGGLVGGLAGDIIREETPAIKFVAALCVLAGIIASARHYLGTHSLLQLLAGFITGFATLFLLMMYLLH